MPKANICLIGLSSQFVDKCGFELSKKLDMFYANAAKIIEFELFDMNRMEEICGKDYLEKKESSILKRLCTYENTILNVEYQLLNNETNYKNIKENCLVIYLKLKKSNLEKILKTENISESSLIISNDLFNDRNYICENKSDVVVSCDNLDDASILDVIMKKIVAYYG